MSDEKLISQSSTLEEFKDRLKSFRHRLYGHSPSDAESNGVYLAWCDGVEFGMKHALRLKAKNED